MNRRLIRTTWTRHSYDSLRRDFWEGGREGVTPSGKSHCRVVAARAIQNGRPYIEVIGGNESNSVRANVMFLNPAGGISQGDYRSVFAMIKLVECDVP